jgi:hypothetical protein
MQIRWSALVFRPIHEMPEAEMEQPFVSHPPTYHMDTVTLVCYGLVILHSCVCALPLRLSREPANLARYPLSLPRVANE